MSAERIRRRVVIPCAAVYAIVLASIAIWPSPVDAPFTQLIGRVITWFHDRGIALWFGYPQLEWSANVLLFIPFGLLLAVFAPARHWWAAVVLGAGVSGLIETAQWLFLSSRFATLDDVVANTLGSAIGALFGLVLHLVLHLRRRTLHRSIDTARRR